MSVKLNNKVYDVLKWLVVLALPALGALYSTLASVWGWPYSQAVCATLDAVALCLGTVLGISCAAYNKENGDGTGD